MGCRRSYGSPGDLIGRGKANVLWAVLAPPRVVADTVRGACVLEPRSEFFFTRPRARPASRYRPFGPTGPGRGFAFRVLPPGCGHARVRPQINAGDETVRGALLH